MGVSDKEKKKCSDGISIGFLVFAARFVSLFLFWIVNSCDNVMNWDANRSKKNANSRQFILFPV